MAPVWAGRGSSDSPTPSFFFLLHDAPGLPNLHPGLHPLLVMPWLVLSLVCGPISGPDVNLKITLSFMVPIKH